MFLVESGNGNFVELYNKVTNQGNVVRKLKADKADKVIPLVVYLLYKNCCC